MWKCSRTVVICKWEAYWDDFSGFNVDLHAGLGGLTYAYGTWIFMKIATPADQVCAATVFVIGGLFFTLSGIFMQWRYFLSKNENKEKFIELNEVKKHKGNI